MKRLLNKYKNSVEKEENYNRINKEISKYIKK